MHQEWISFEWEGAEAFGIIPVNQPMQRKISGHKFSKTNKESQLHIDKCMELPLL